MSASTPNHSGGNREIDSELKPGNSDLGDIEKEGGGSLIHYFPLFLQSENCRITTEPTESLIKDWMGSNKQQIVYGREGCKYKLSLGDCFKHSKYSS